MQTKKIHKELRKYASKEYTLVSRRFFKTGKSGYGEGDVFMAAHMFDISQLAR